MKFVPIIALIVFSISNLIIAESNKNDKPNSSAFNYFVSGFCACGAIIYFAYNT